MLKEKIYIMLTRTVQSLAVKARISAQDTVWGHAFSTSALISSITSNPRIEFLLGIDPFSDIMLPLLSSSTDASHPCYVTRTNVTYFALD